MNTDHLTCTNRVVAQYYPLRLQPSQELRGSSSWEATTVQDFEPDKAHESALIFQFIDILKGTKQ